MVVQEGLSPALLTEPGDRAYLGGTSRDTFYRLRKAGLIKPIFLGRAVRYAVKNLDEVIERIQAEPGLIEGGDGSP
jgi:hypothetical protein